MKGISPPSPSLGSPSLVALVMGGMGQHRVTLHPHEVAPAGTIRWPAGGYFVVTLPKKLTVMEVLAGGIEHQAGLCFLGRGIVVKPWSSLTASPSSPSFFCGVSSPPGELSATSTLLSPGAAPSLRGARSRQR